MKYIQYIKAAIFGLLLLIVSINAKGQCDLKLQEKIERELKEDKVTFLKSFSADLGPGNDVAAYSMVLKKRTWYRFYIYESEQTDGKGHFEMADDDGILGSTMNSFTARRYPYFDFKCNKTKIYHLTIMKDSGENFCAEVVLAFVKEIHDEEKISEAQKNIEPANQVFMIVEKMPVFVEGENTTEAFNKWLHDNVVYPEEAKQSGIEGRVFVSFVVNNKGEIEDVQIVRGIDPVLDNYTLDLIKNSPKWASPGYQRGEAVNVKFTFPVLWRL